MSNPMLHEPPDVLPESSDTEPDTAAPLVQVRRWPLALTRWLASAALLVALLVIWEIWVRLADTPRWLLPPPSAIGRTLVTERTLLLTNTWVTLKEVVLGFAIALAAGVLLAAAIDASRIVERLLYPIIVASQTVPIAALAPLLLIWFGYGLLPKILVTALVGFFPIAVNGVDGLRGADREQLALLSTLGAGRWLRFRLVKMPGALPFVFSGAKIAVAVCVIGAVFGELVGASAGLGYLMRRSAGQFLTTRVFACVILLSLLGIGLFALIAIIERLALPWRRYRGPSE